VSADTLVYFGDLEGVLVAATEALRPNSFLVFTLEHAAGGGPDVDYRLGFHGRYSHGGAYVEGILTAVGLQLKVVHCELRMEAGVPVAGLVVRATKSVATRF
jgi:predicted TPR repeat methyltransferase